MLSQQILNFLFSLSPPRNIPEGIGVLYPHREQEVKNTMKAFYEKYFSDNKPRVMITGINPGRFGGGITGIHFTAPRQLSSYCQIDHPFGNSSELSAEFIYKMIEAYGGPEKFYGDYYLTAMSPLGFIRDGKNINYYDEKELAAAVRPFIVKCMEEQLSWSVSRDICYCIGGDKNLKYLSLLNSEHGWFKKLEALPHPRFIMQYRRKKVDLFIEEYLQKLRRSSPQIAR